MQETKRMADEARKTAHDYQEQAQKVGQEYLRAIEGGAEAATHAFSEMNKGFQAVAAEVTDFSKKRFEDVVEAWDQFVRARTFGDMSKCRAGTPRKHMTPTRPKSPSLETYILERRVMLRSRLNRLQKGSRSATPANAN
jgi:Phasin protein